MPHDDPFHKSPDDFDPEQTLFFQRRKKNVNLLPIIVVCVLLLGSGALLVWAFSQPGKHDAQTEASPAINSQDKDPGRSSLTPEQASALQKAPRAQAVNTPAPFDPAKPVLSARPIGTVPPAAPAVTVLPAQPVNPLPTAQTADADLPPMPDGNAPLNLDVKDPGNARVRDEVLRRIDLMPGVSAANKDKLYASVDRARSMGRLLTIPFVKGETAVRPADVDRLKGQLASPAVRATLDDPTAVLVVLGYADPKGNDRVNADLSLSRAKAVLDSLRERCGVQNVMHSVAMGGSTLFSTDQAEKNRVVEVWAVLP